MPQAFDNGNYLQAELKKVLAGNAKVTDVRGLGYMIGIETTENLAELVEKARDKGLIVLTAGTKCYSSLATIDLDEGRNRPRRSHFGRGFCVKAREVGQVCLNFFLS